MGDLFHYSPYTNPYVPTEAALMMAPAQARARAAEASGQAWGQAASSIGQDVAGAVQQYADPRRMEAQQRIDDLKRLDKAFAQPGGRDAIVNALPGHLKPIAMKQFADADEAAAKVQTTQLAAESATNEYVYGLADNIKAHGYDPHAAQLAIAHAKQTFANNPSLLQQVAQIEEAIHTDPTPDRVQAVVDPIIQARNAMKAKPPEPFSLGPNGKRFNADNTLAASNPVTEKPTEASLAADLSSPDPAVRERAKVAIAALKQRTPAESELDAYAKSLGKARAEDLTYAERQQFDKDKAKVGSDQAFTQHQRERQYDIKNPIPEKGKSQDALEQEYRTVLARGLSSRSGGLGLEDAKVQQANHLTALMDQNYDPKTGNYNIPKVQYEELALGLARLVSPGGVVGEGLKNDLVQATAQGDVNKIATYFTGHPFTGSTQDVFKMLRESIDRQGQVAMQNREGEMRYLRGLAPTDLDEARRTKLEATTLNPLRQSRIIQNTQTGERRLQVSIDGGATWK